MKIECPVSNEALREEYEVGRLSGVARKHGVSIRVARRWVGEAGIEVHGRGRPRVDEHEFQASLEYRHPGILGRIGVDTDASIARDYDLSRERVRQYRSRLGVDRANVQG
jgi:hypothetical protein